MYRGHIFNALSDRFYDLYTMEPSTKVIWNNLEFKYQVEEESTKKILISKYFDYKFINDKPILVQVHELQVIVNQLKAEKMELLEPFQVGAIIKLLSS